MIHLNSGPLGAALPKNPHVQTEIEPPHPRQSNVTERETDRIDFSAGHAEDRTFPRATPLPTDLAREIDRLYEARTAGPDIAKIINEKGEHAYDITPKRVDMYLRWGDTSTEAYLPSHMPIPADMLREIHRLHDAGKGESEITLTMNENKAHPYALRVSRIASYRLRNDPFGRPLLPPKTPMPESMEQAIHQLAKPGVSPKTIARELHKNPEHQYSVPHTRIARHLLRERALPNNKPIPESMRQEIDRLYRLGKRGLAIASTMNENEQFPYAIFYGRIESYLRRKTAAKRRLPASEPIPEIMRQEIELLAQIGNAPTAIAAMMKSNPLHPYAIPAARIRSYLRSQSNPENFVVPKRKRSSRAWQMHEPITRNAAEITHAEFDDIDLDAVLAGIVGDEGGHFDFLA